MTDESNGVAASAGLLAGLLVLVGATTWAGGALSALVTGHAVKGGPISGFQALLHASNPAQAWGGSVGPTWSYWLITALVFLVGSGIVAVGVLVCGRFGLFGPSSQTGVADAQTVRKVAGVAQLRRRAKTLRPGKSDAEPSDVGIVLGRAHGIECWASVEDSVLVLGPPRSGKGLHLVINAILDAPGAVVTTSTRPDNLAVTMAQRSLRGTVAVFDPQGLMNGVSDVRRWSPIRGCEQPATAIARARVLCADSTGGVENGSFWSQQANTAVRCLLHAAAIDRRMPLDLLRWSLSPLAAEDAADVLRTNPSAAAAWATGLESILGSDPRQRDSIWAMVSNSFSALSDPAVLEAVTPSPGNELDPEQLLRDRGTIYLLGSTSGASASATLIAALIEDVVETAKRMAARSTGARLVNPLSLVLDEAANYPLPSLMSLMSEGGGSGISTMVVLQSLAQARARWGAEQAAAVWDSAIVKLVLGGGGGAEDLRALSSLLGEHDERQASHTWGERGHRSTSVTTREKPVFDVASLRTMPFGRALLLLRTAPPIELRLRPWTARRDSDALRQKREEFESLLHQSAAGRWP